MRHLLNKKICKMPKLSTIIPFVQACEKRFLYNKLFLKFINNTFEANTYTVWNTCSG